MTEFDEYSTVFDISLLKQMTNLKCYHTVIGNTVNQKQRKEKHRRIKEDLQRFFCRVMLTVTTLSGVSYASVTSKLTPDSVVTYLFHDV